MPTQKELARQIRNARRRLARLEKQRAQGPEAGEALTGGPLATDFIGALDKQIKKEETLIARFSKERAELAPKKKIRS